MPERWILGLGNPGAQYAETRHNVGFWVLDFWATRHGKDFVRSHASEIIRLPGKGRLVKPLTFMNRSGAVLKEALDLAVLPADILVVVDDIHLPPGRMRVRSAGSTGGHNGLADIEAVLGTKTYPRCRIGVGAPNGVNLADFVLDVFPKDEKIRVMETVQRTTGLVDDFLAGESLAALVQRYNQDGSILGPLDRDQE